MGQNIWFHDLFKQLLLNFSIQEEKHTYCIKCGPKSWKHLFPVAEEKKEPKGLGAFGKQSQPLIGGWVFCCTFSCQCQGNKTEIFPESERLLKPGPLHVWETGNGFFLLHGKKARKRQKARWQVKVMDSPRDRTRVWISRPEFAF